MFNVVACICGALLFGVVAPCGELSAQKPPETPPDNADIKISYQASATCTKDLRLALVLGSARPLSPSGESSRIEFSYDGRQKGEEHYLISYREGKKSYKIAHNAKDDKSGDPGNDPNPSPGAIEARRIAEFVFHEKESGCHNGGQPGAAHTVEAVVSSNQHVGPATSLGSDSSTVQVPPPPPQVSPAAAHLRYDGAKSGTLSCSGEPIPENAEYIFRDLPLVKMHLDYDTRIWEATLEPGEGPAQRLVLRNKTSKPQKKCAVHWTAIP